MPARRRRIALALVALVLALILGWQRGLWRGEPPRAEPVAPPPPPVAAREEPSEEPAETGEAPIAAVEAAIPPCNLGALRIHGELPREGSLRAGVDGELIEQDVTLDGAILQVPAALRGAAGGFLDLEGFGRAVLGWDAAEGCRMMGFFPADAAEAELVEIRCPVDLTGPPPTEISMHADAGVKPTAFLPDGSPGPIPPLEVRLEGDELAIEGPETGAGTLFLVYEEEDGEKDYFSLPVSWSPEGCDAVRIGHWGTIRGRIAGLEPGEEAHVEGCGGGATSEGGRYEMRADSAPCEVAAYRIDGVLNAYGPAVAVDPIAGGVVTADLSLPEAPAGGIGVSIAGVESGFVVTGVQPGMPAYEAGLLAGDVVVSVDGRSCAGVSHTGFTRMVVGPVGTRVRLEVLRADERFVLGVERAWMEERVRPE